MTLMDFDALRRALRDCGPGILKDLVVALPQQEVDRLMQECGVFGQAWSKVGHRGTCMGIEFIVVSDGRTPPAYSPAFDIDHD